MSTQAPQSWLAMQASVAAERLKAVPTELLGPAGRSLQESARLGTFALRDLTAVPTGAGPAPVDKKSRGSRRGGSTGSVQPPLMLGVNTPTN
jgi:hypothetical protein